jgi:hypothetical protein
MKPRTKIKTGEMRGNLVSGEDWVKRFKTLEKPTGAELGRMR